MKRLPKHFDPRDSQQRLFDQLNEMSKDLYGHLGGYRATPPLNVFEDGDGNVNFWMDYQPGFWARLTSAAVSSSQALYSWVRVVDDGSGHAWTTTGPPNSGTSNAFESNGNSTIAVPLAPTGVAVSGVSGGTLTLGQAYFWTITATFTGPTGAAGLQSPISAEVTFTPSGGQQTAGLSWTAPAAATGFTLTGFTIWRGTTAGNEAVEVATTAAGTTSYNDTGSAGSAQSPIQGGTAGPVVWLTPLDVYGFYQFSYPSNNLTVTDGTTTVNNVTRLKFTSGAIVTNAGGGEADVAVSAGASFSGAQFSGLPATTCGTGATTSLSQTTGTTIYDTGSPAYGLTLKAPVAGYYAGVFTMVMTSGTTAFAAHVVTSGAQQLADSVTNSGTAGGSLNVSWQGHLAANETVALQVFQASGGNTTCNIKSQSIAKIG